MIRPVLGIALVAHALAAFVYAFLITDPSVRNAVYLGTKLVINALPAVWIFGIERRSFRLLRPGFRDIAAGIGSGLAIGALIVGFHHWFAADRIDPAGVVERVRGFGLVENFAFYAPLICLINAGIEEYYWRWFVYGGLRRFMKPLSAGLLSALGFTLHHIIVVRTCFPDAGLVLVLSAGVFIGGCVWAYLYERLGSLYAPYFSHMLADAGIMFVAYGLLHGG